jgi:hypothetical protein
MQVSAEPRDETTVIKEGTVQRSLHEQSEDGAEWAAMDALTSPSSFP